MQVAKLASGSTDSDSSGSDKFNPSLAGRSMNIPKLVRSPSESDEDSEETLCGLSPESSARHNAMRNFVKKLRHLLTAETGVKSRLNLDHLNKRLREINKNAHLQRNSCPLDASSQWVCLSVRIKRENPEILISEKLALRKTKSAGSKTGKASSVSDGGDRNSEEQSLLNVWTRQILMRAERASRLFYAIQPLLHRLGYRAKPFSVTAGDFSAASGASSLTTAGKGGKSATAVEELNLLETVGTLSDRGVSEVFINFDPDA